MQSTPMIALWVWMEANTTSQQNQLHSGNQYSHDHLQFVKAYFDIFHVGRGGISSQPMIVWHTQTGRSCAAADAEVGDHSPSKPSGISTYCRRFQWQIRTACNQTFYFQIQWDVHRFLRSSTGFTEFRQFRDAQAVHSEYRLAKRFTWLHFAHQKLKKRSCHRHLEVSGR